MTNEEIRSACDRAATIANDFEYDELRVEAFGVILSSFLQAGGKQQIATSRTPIPTQAAETKPAKSSKGRAGSGLMSRLGNLLDEGFFSVEKSAQEIHAQLKVSGWNHKPKEISARLIELVRQRKLRRAEVRQGAKAVFRYSNWQEGNNER